MKVIKVTKEYFETEDEKVYFFEPLEKEISVKDMQKIVDTNEKLVKVFVDREEYKISKIVGNHIFVKTVDGEKEVFERFIGWHSVGFSFKQ